MKDMLEKIRLVTDTAITACQIVGASIIVAQHGTIEAEYHAGMAHREEGRVVTEQTIFRLASMTKPIVSATALALAERGILDLDEPITRWLPSFRPKAPDGTTAYITLRHLLTHTSGLSYGFLSPDNEPYRSAGISDGLDEKTLSLEENLRRISTVSLMFPPGSSWCYSLATDVLGALLEQACQKPLPILVKQYVTDPLGMTDTTFVLEDESRLVRAYADRNEINGEREPRIMCENDQVLLPGCGPIHYSPGRATNVRAYASGGAGMVGTARDYLKFLEVIRQGGSPILCPKSVSLMIHDAVEGFDVNAAGPGFGFGLGFAIVRDSKIAGTPRYAGSYGWGGVYGTSMYVDPEVGLTVVILTNTALYGLMEFPNLVTASIY